MAPPGRDVMEKGRALGAAPFPLFTGVLDVENGHDLEGLGIYHQDLVRGPERSYSRAIPDRSSRRPLEAGDSGPARNRACDRNREVDVPLRVRRCSLRITVVIWCAVRSRARSAPAGRSSSASDRRRSWFPRSSWCCRGLRGPRRSSWCCRGLRDLEFILVCRDFTAFRLHVGCLGLRRPSPSCP